MRKIAVGLIAGLTLVLGVAAVSFGQESGVGVVQVGYEDPDTGLDVNAFFPSRIVVNLGDTIAWNFRTLEEHTVIFLSQEQEALLEAPQQLLQEFVTEEVLLATFEQVALQFVWSRPVKWCKSTSSC